MNNQSLKREQLLRETMILSLDLGTSHIKAGLFARSGEIIRTATLATNIHHHPSGNKFYDPEEMWAGVINVITIILEEANPKEVSTIGITSMAETGLLVDRRTGYVRSEMIPWHDARAVSQVNELTQDRGPFLQFCRSGIRPNFKCSLAKLLWLRDTSPGLLNGSTWLSTADYIAFRLTDVMATDYSLAGRTYAFRIDELTWDEDWLQELGLPADIFPQAYPSTRPIGELNKAAASLLGLRPGLPICICGHDHVCAAFAAAGTGPGKVLDSMGTAEALIGSFDQVKLGDKEYESGLVFGRHVSGGGYYWMGGMSTSGGSLDWLRKILGEPQLSYEEFERLVEAIPPGPTRIIFLPYLAGSGSPHTDIHLRGAFIGLDQAHDRYDLIKAIFEGTAFEMEFIRQAAQGILKDQISSLVAAGGGSRITHWMQVKADVSGCIIEVPTLSDATLLGAALVAGIGSDLYDDEGQARTSFLNSSGINFHPNRSHHQLYQQVYHEGFVPLQEPLRTISKILSSAFSTAEG
jgi:xylulokinase